MAKVYGGIQGITKPKITSNWQKYDSLCEKYVNAITKWAKDNSKCPEAGEEIHFGVADGRARYVVLSLKPVELVHLDVGDGYQFQYVNRLTAGDIKNELKRAQALNKLFARTEA